MRKEIKREQEPVTWLSKKGAKTLQSVAAFLSKAEWNCSDVYEVAQVLGNNLLIIGSEMCNVFDFSWNIVIIIVHSRLKLYDFTILTAGVEPNTQTTGKAIQLLLHGIRFVSKHLELLEHRATSSAGKPVSILLGIAEKFRSSFLLGSLQFRLLLDFRIDSPWMCDSFY